MAFYPSFSTETENWYTSFEGKGLAFRTAPGIEIFLSIGVSALLLAGITVGWQALKAARTNPVEALRYE
ncbi:MAG TPA: hypothetical protein ENL46_06425 [Candidatus Aminicenantes bacterium]|nr:hypothetical protein [Candidatus Aminicenantes bacterium]